jgi:hypothetical protein
MAVEIESDIPVPEARSGVAKPEYTQLRELMMQLYIGGSFFFPTETVSKERYVRNAMWRLKVTEPVFQGWTIQTRKLVEGETTGIRLWRKS